MGVAWTRGHCSWAPPPGRAAGSCRGSWLPWGGEPEHLLGQEEAVLRVPHPVLHAPAAPHGEGDVAGHGRDRLSLNADHCRGTGRGTAETDRHIEGRHKGERHVGDTHQESRCRHQDRYQPRGAETHTQRNTTQRRRRGRNMERKIQIRIKYGKDRAPREGGTGAASEPTPPPRGLGPTASTLPAPASCTQVVRDNQGALKGLERIAHQVNEVLHHPEQVHRAGGHLGTGGR